MTVGRLSSCQKTIIIATKLSGKKGTQHEPQDEFQQRLHHQTTTTAAQRRIKQTKALT
jgi:hypothetical protein